MRQKLNENPVAQAAVVGLLAIAVGFLLLTRVVGGGAEADESAPSPAPATDAPSAQIQGEIDPEQGAAAAAAAAEAIEAGDAQGAFDAIAAAALRSFEPGPGLPRRVVDAYEDGKAIAVLITRKRGIEDRRLRRMQARIRGVGDVAGFHAYARDIARFSRITGGVDVNRVPALVVVRPRGDGELGIPVASVSYGFRGPASAEQAVRDALYEGRRDIPYHPYPEREDRER